MNSKVRLLATLSAFFLLTAYGCGDEDGGCGPAPQKKEEPAAPGIGGAPSGGGGRAAELITSDKKGRVPKPYQRQGAYDKENDKSDRKITKPVIAVSSTPAAMPLARIPVKVTKRRVDGIVDRVELICKILASSADGRCANSANYIEIKARCCPGGLVERCESTTGGVLIVGRGCEPAP